MPLRVAVALPEDASPEAGGVALVVAAAKLHSYELHEVALQAKSDEVGFDARTDEFETLVECYLLVPGSDMEGGGMFLAAELESPVEYVQDVKKSIGKFAEEVQLFSMRPVPKLRADVLGEEEIESFADELGYQLPHDWRYRAKALTRKHYPPPVIADYAPPRREYAMPDVSSQRRCQCGNYAADSSGECNACKRQRAGEVARAIAERLSADTAKRARVSEPGPGLQRV
jgi:hypothetical protein